MIIQVVRVVLKVVLLLEGLKIGVKVILRFISFLSVKGVMSGYLKFGC